MDYQKLQKDILRAINFLERGGMLRDSELVILGDLTRGGEAWKLTELERVAQDVDNTPSQLLARVTGNRYRDFLSDDDVEIEPGREQAFIAKRIRAAGWKKPIITVKDLIEVSELLGKDVDYVLALLMGEDSSSLEIRALKAAL